jgi:filamentous hemagglutinin family protein
VRSARFKLKPVSIIAASIHLLFPETLLWANPTGPQVVNGAASFATPDARTLNVTNSPGAVIHWQSFSIGAGEVTRFIQQSPSSAVLNRVIGPDISQLYGQLLSNGRVFLINPAGIIVGPGAVIDTAGFVASTLNMLDADFLAGKLKFQGDASSGSIINQGWIRTGYGGHVVLVAPHIENSGLIHTPGGELILAAGQKLTISSLDHEGVQFEVQAPTDSVLNVGKLLADGGAVGVFAGTLRHSGEIRANALVYDEAGRIVLRTSNEMQIASGSTTRADGKAGGSIVIDSGQGSTRVAGEVTARGNDGRGGNISLLGDRVAVVENAAVDASGSTGGGKILVGGDFQGTNPDIHNAASTFVGSNATLRADATQVGDGGRIIVWSDDKTQFYGSLSARGGQQEGNGGFAEVSGKQNLIFAGSADLSAPRGSRGTLLLDPLDLYVFAGGGIDPTIINESSDFPSNAATVSPATLGAVSGNVSLFASRYMRISDPIDFSATPGKGLTAQVGTYAAPASPDPLALSTGTIFNELEIGASITTAGGAVSLIAPTIQSIASSTISTGGGAISLNTSGSTISASQLSLDAGTGTVTATSGSSIQLNAVSGGSFTAVAPGFISTGAIATSGGQVNLTSTGSFVSTGSISSGGGNVILNAGGSSVNTSNITAGGGNVTLTGQLGVSTSTIDTSGSVALSAPGGSIFSTVNNASSLTASAGSSVVLSSATDIHVDAVAAGSFGTAFLSTSGGSILPIGSGSQVTGLDVTLQSTGAGGRVGTAAQALNVDAQRNFTFTANGEFNILLNGTGPHQFAANMGPAMTGTYAGTVTKQSGGLTLDVSANTSTVTVNSLAITSGFDQQFFGFSNPSISVQAINGANLVADTVTVPTGDTVSTLSFPNGFPLPVMLGASGNLTVNSYTRAGGGLPKQTAFTSSSGTITLGTIDASRDSVTVTGSGNISVADLSAAGNVTVTSGIGDITIGKIDTTSGTGSVTLSASLSAGAVKAQTDSSALEISSGGAVSISAFTIGTNSFANPFDVAGSSVELTSRLNGGTIGFANAPVVANTQNLTISAATPSAVNIVDGAEFNVSTGPVALKNLTVLANPLGVGSGGLAQVVTEVGGANQKTYTFASDGTDFTLNPGVVPATQFAGGTFNFTSNAGSINLTGNTNFGAGNLVLTTNGSAINSGGSSIVAANVTLTASNSIDTDTGAITATGAGGSVTLRANTSVTAGDLNAPGSVSIQERFCCSSPAVSVGNIGNSTAPQSIGIFGSTVDTGTVTGAGNITLSASGGLLTAGGAITTTGSTINLDSNGATPFFFSSIDAGTAGTVLINSPKGIRQVFGGTGIKGQTITLNASGGDVAGSDSLGGANAPLDLLNGTNPLNLTVDTGGKALLEANGNTLASLTVTKRTIPDVAAFSMSGLGGSQSVALGGGASDLDVAVSSTTPLNFTLNYSTGNDILLAGSGIVSGGGSVSLTSSGGINATTGGITSGGGNIQLTALGGGVVTGAIDASGSGGSIQIVTFGSPGHIDISGNVTTGTGGGPILLSAQNGGNVTRSGSFTIHSDSSVTVTTANGEIGTPGTPLLITSPVVGLAANRGGSATANEGLVSATLSGTFNLSLTGHHGFNVSSDTNFTNLLVGTRGSGTGAVTLTSPGQTFDFSRQTDDLFGTSVGNIFRISGVSSSTPLANATFSIIDSAGTLLVTGPISATNLSLTSVSGGDISLQGTAANPLALSNGTQTFNASSGPTADILIRGNVTLNATGNQVFSSTGNITVSADAGGGGSISITAPTQTFTTTGGASKMEFLGGAAVDEKVTISATNQQTVNASGSSTAVDSFKLKGGAGSGASVTFTHSGSGFQQIQVSGGSVTVEGGSGQNAFAKLETTGINQQKLCQDSFFIFCGAPIGALNILGGSGIGARADVVAAGSQVINVSSATTVKGGAGDGADALLQSGTAQTFFFAGALTVEGGSGIGSNGNLVAGGSQSINAGNILVKAGSNTGSAAGITAGGSQSISGSNLTVTAGGAGQSVEPFFSVPDSSAIIEGHNQNISVSSITLDGGAGAPGGTSDAVLRNLSGGQSIFASASITLNGGHTESTAGIINQGTGTQTVTGNGGILVKSDPNLPPAHADSFVLIQNQASTLQTINATNGGLTLMNSGDGSVTVTSAGDQNVTSRFVDISTTASSTGNATLSATGNQRIHTTNGTFGANGSMRIAALGSGMASIASGASQLLELDYPEQMQSVRDGTLTIGDASAVGNSLIQAVDQSVFARSILIQAGSGAGSTAKLTASNTQTLTTLQGGISLTGGSGNNSLASIDPLVQTILSNGTVSLLGGVGGNADASIVSSGSQTVFTTNGNITLMGGSGSGADAFISSFGTQLISTTGNITLQPVVGDAFISGGPTALAPVAILDTTSLTLPLQEITTLTIGETAVTGEPAESELERRIPICR